MQLPSGTVTFLFTDIERSTQSAKSLGDEAWAEALDAHRDLLRPCFDKHGGVEVGTEGDAFFVAFAKATDAIEAAVQGQRALENQALKVRMGIHTGEALVRGGDYVGHEVHRAKRISDAGHGGQILLSQTTADLASNDSLKDLGPHRLKDLTEPQRIFQIGPADFPPLRSLESFTHNLPLQRSTFVGRESEIALVRKLLDDHRIVTLTGVGGCGKTRLALQVGAELIEAYPDGVFFADLAPISEPPLVLGTVAGAVGVPVSETAAGTMSAPAEQVLFEFLARRTCLLLIDNCEHLLDSCADVADRILSSCPGVTILATSREGLEIEGERAFTVPSMSLPDDTAAPEASEAVSLFKARALEVRPGFDLTPDNVGAVASICRRLDGIPLAIEFAASRVSHLTPREIDERLAESFRLLAGGRRRVQRQQTIAATLDWSYDLLGEPERVLLRRLSAFAGTFTLEAAEAVCADDGIRPDEVLDLLASLVAKSLLDADGSGERTRYRLLETVRLYAADKLKDAGESDTTHGRHRDFYLAWVEQIPWDQAFSSDLVAAALEIEGANLMAALEWSASQQRPDVVVRMVARMGMLATSYGEEFYRWASLAHPEELDIDDEVRVAYLTCAAGSGIWHQSADVGELYDRAIAAAEGRRCLALGIAIGSRALIHAVEASFTQDAQVADTCRKELDESLAICADYSPFATGIINYMRGLCEMTMGELDRCVEPLEAALDQLDPDHHRFWLMFALSGLAAIAHVNGDHETAVERATQALEYDEVLREPNSATATAAVAAFAGAGDIGRAKDVLRDSLDGIRRSIMPGRIEELMVGFAAVYALAGDATRASRLLWWVRSQTLDMLRGLRSPVSYPIYRHYTRVLRETLGADEAHRARDEARTWSEEDAVACALEGLDD